MQTRCSDCGRTFECEERVANGEGPAFCDGCDETHAALQPRRREYHETEPDYGGVLGADNQVHSDADPGL